MANVWAENLEIKYQGKGPKVLNIRGEKILDFGETLWQEILHKYPKVGDCSLHSINEKLAKLGVQSTKAKWEVPLDRGVRPQDKVETVGESSMLNDQMQDYVQRGYLNEVSVE